jgi:hypothetical protein
MEKKIKGAESQAWYINNFFLKKIILSSSLVLSQCILFLEHPTTSGDQSSWLFEKTGTPEKKRVHNDDAVLFLEHPTTSGDQSSWLFVKTGSRVFFEF